MPLPPSFIDHMRTLLPEPSSLQAFLASCQRPLRRSIRINTLKISVADFLALTAPYGWRLTPIPWCATGFWIERDNEAQWALGSAAEHLSGLFYIQEASSMLPVTALLAANPPALADNHAWQVLDMAAAPGSKTTQLAAAMANEGILLANEFSASRCKILHANLSRCGVSNCVLTQLDGRVFGQHTRECFDAILLDAPCSGEGMIRKDADALRGWSAKTVQAMAATQRQLIDSAFHALRPGGVLVYSTCTLNHSENQQVCQYLLTQYPDAAEIQPLHNLFDQAALALTPEGFLHVFPQLYDSEGFFVARLRKTRSLLPEQANAPASARQRNIRHASHTSNASHTSHTSHTNNTSHKNFPFTPLTAANAQIVRQAAADLGLHWSNNHQLWQRQQEIWLFPQQISAFIGKIRLSRIGLKLAEQHNKGYRWQHEAIIALAGAHNPLALELDSQQAQLWYQGQDIYPPHLPAAAEIIVSHQGQPVGYAKKIGNRLKNYYPRELVRNGKLFIA